MDLVSLQILLSTVKRNRLDLTPTVVGRARSTAG